MSETLLGTPLEEARDDDRARTVLLSDLHVPHDGGAVLDDLRSVLRDATARAAETRVLVLGDLFDFLTGPRHLAVGAYRNVVAALAAAVRAGVSVTVLHGNRDFMLDGAFERACGARVVAGGLRFRLGERPCLAVHGDELCLLDRPYLRVKRVLRHPLAKAFARSLPLRAALRVGAWTRGRAGAQMPTPGSDRYEPVASALRLAFAHGVDLVVFGHIHRPARGVFEGRGEYCILPAFDARGVHLLFADGALRYRTPAGGWVEDYPARAFPELA